jgi:hypothetical protein
MTPITVKSCKLHNVILSMFYEVMKKQHDHSQNLALILKFLEVGEFTHLRRRSGSVATT